VVRHAGLILALVMPLAVAFWYRSVLVQVLAALAFNAMPLAIGAAILRYRLYDIDRIVSRTLAYGLLTVVLGLAYAGVVLGLGRLLRRPDHPGVQWPAAPAGRPGHLDRRAAGRRGPDDAAGADDAVAAAVAHRHQPPRPVTATQLRYRVSGG
jgi:hypothetical protein